MTRDELSREVRAVMFLVSSEASLDGFDDRTLADAHAGLMAVIDQYLAARAGPPAPGGVTRVRSRAG